MLYRFFIFALIFFVNVSIFQSPNTVAGHTYDDWSPETTSYFIRGLEPFRATIRALLEEEIPADKTVLEIGSGPLGGVLHYLGDRPNITPTEPNSDSFRLLAERYPRAH